MKIVVVSDTHRDIDVLDSIRFAHPDADYYIHCGDSEVPSDLVNGFATVKGNCDIFYDYPTQLRFETEYGVIHVEHGHRLDYSHNDSLLLRDAFLILHGHTHKHYFKEYLPGKFVANPGSLTRPRDGTRGTYLVIEIKDKDNIKFNFYELD